jgi:hypothetical protein
VDTFEFSAHELSQEDSSTCKIGYNFNIDEIKEMLSHLGFESEVIALTGKCPESEELWPLLFIQFTEEENWRSIVRDKLHILSLRVRRHEI